MSTWINTDVDFPARRILLTLSKKDVIGRQLPGIYSDPEYIENYVRGLIRVAREELSECTLHCIRLNPGAYRWEFLIEHPSLPVVEDGCMCDEMPLFKEEAT